MNAMKVPAARRFFAQAGGSPRLFRTPAGLRTGARMFADSAKTETEFIKERKHIKAHARATTGMSYYCFQSAIDIFKSGKQVAEKGGNDQEYRLLACSYLKIKASYHLAYLWILCCQTVLLAPLRFPS